VSFFDEVDEVDEPRTEPTPQRRRRTTGSGRRPPTRRPPGDQKAVRVRRAIAVAALVVVVILIVLGVHSCQVSQRNSSLRDYNNNVSTLIQDSNQTGKQFFRVLSNGSGSGGAVNLQNQIDEAGVTADKQLSRAKGIDVPGEVKSAQQNLLLTLQMRRDGITNIAQQIQPALSNATSRDAINNIAGQMARFYASDVLYKGYTLPLIAGALKNAGINGQTFNGGQFLTDIQWLTPSFVAGQLHVSVPSATGSKPTPGLHGHSLDSVSVGGTTLQTGSTNTIPASPPPSFTLNFSNGGTNTENNIACKVTVSGGSISGKATVPQTTAGQHATCNVTLNSSPPAGSYTVTATISKVPGEKNIDNNTMTFPVTFQ
jgi:hypothetical protein